LTIAKGNAAMAMTIKMKTTMTMTLQEKIAQAVQSGKFKLIYQTIKSSGLFDEHYYQAGGTIEPAYPNALAHYILTQAAFTRDPSPWFSTAWYLWKNPDVYKDKLNPLYHYIQHGETENRQPNPFFKPMDYGAINPDLRGNWNDTLLLHYIQLGKNENRHFDNQLHAAAKLLHRNRYHSWILKNESSRFRTVEQRLKTLLEQPLLSVLVPVYNTNERYLIRCIESVLHQSFENWQLCLADDGSTLPHVREILSRYAQQSERISCVHRERNGNISAASNSALEIATGEWIVLLDHDDELHEHALFHVADAINNQPGVKLIYSDEDKINAQEERSDPHFKCDWNPDLLYSQNYISHMGAYRTDIVRKIGGFRVGYEGSQDYDLLLRYSRALFSESSADNSSGNSSDRHATSASQAADVVCHIARPLYHWRSVEGSTAFAAAEKKYTTLAGIKALEDHFRALNQPVEITQGESENTYRVIWPIDQEPLVSLIIPMRNAHHITQRAIDSVLGKTTYRNYEILLIDNQSDDPAALRYLEAMSSHEKVTVLRHPYPFNFSAINNRAVARAKGDIIGLLNNDIEVISPDWLTEMVSHAMRDDIGCVGAKLYYPDDRIQHAGVILGIGGVAGHSHKYFKGDEHGYFSRLKLIQNVSAVTAACLVVRKSIYDEVGGLDEENLAIAFNDVDFCLKVRERGYRNLWTPYAQLYHHESISRGAEDTPEKVQRFNSEAAFMIDKWNDKLRVDPCYSRNLTLEREDFSIDDQVGRLSAQPIHQDEPI
jgi:glycosyltransferase involved in cell wall biosynthesis